MDDITEEQAMDILEKGKFAIVVIDKVTKVSNHVVFYEVPPTPEDFASLVEELKTDPDFADFSNDDLEFMVVTGEKLEDLKTQIKEYENDEDEDTTTYVH